jgi:ADP-ribose pyrophosphatase YjhB (NUDIX family)
MTRATGDTRVKLIADVCLVAQDQVLFIRYKPGAGHDGQEGWFLPDDLLVDFEPPAEAAIRALLEQTGVTAEDPFLSHVESFAGKDESWHLAFHFVLQLPKRPSLTPGEGVAETRWDDLAALPPRGEVAHEGWALNTIREILERAAG